jgi:hypothetical protein
VRRLAQQLAERDGLIERQQQQLTDQQEQLAAQQQIADLHQQLAAQRQVAAEQDAQIAGL